MLYVNGANAAAAVPSSGRTARTARPKSCHKTATDCKISSSLFICQICL